MNKIIKQFDFQDNMMIFKDKTDKLLGIIIMESD